MKPDRQYSFAMMQSENRLTDLLDRNPPSWALDFLEEGKVIVVVRKRNAPGEVFLLPSFITHPPTSDA